MCWYWSQRLPARKPLDQARAPVVVHAPLDCRPGSARVDGAPLKSRLRHYTNLDKMAGKLTELVHEFAWGRMDLLAHRESELATGRAA